MQQVIGHGMPVARQEESKAPRGLKFSAFSFQGLGSKPLSLSETLAKAEWGKLLPEVSVLEPYFKAQLFNSGFKFYTATNVINFLASFLFLIASIGLLVRFSVFVSNDDLSEDENDAESARVFTDILGYFIAPFIITICSAIVNQISLCSSRRSSKEELELICTEYKTLKKSFIDSHNEIAAFFKILELMTEIHALPLDYRYSQRLYEIETQLKAIFTKIKLPFSLLEGTPATQLHQLHPSYICSKLKEVLLGRKFEFVLNQIKHHLKKVAVDLFMIKMLDNAGVYTEAVIDSYCNKIDNDTHTLHLILEYIGAISIKKTSPASSFLLQPIELTEESTLANIKDALVRYWNRNKLIHPYDVNLAELARILHIKMQSTFPTFVISDRAVDVVLPYLVTTPPPPLPRYPLPTCTLLSTTRTPGIAYVPQVVMPSTPGALVEQDPRHRLGYTAV